MKYNRDNEFIPETTNLPWRQQAVGFPYKDDVLSDPEYLADRKELFSEAGNGWWWYPVPPKKTKMGRPKVKK